MTAWLTAATPVTLWRNTVVFQARCPECGRDAVWIGHRGSGSNGATDTVYDRTDCPPCDRDWTARAQARRRAVNVLIAAA